MEHKCDFDSNFRRQSVVNITSNNIVKVVMVNGYQFEVDIELAEDVLDIKLAIGDHFSKKYEQEFIEKHGDIEDKALMNQYVREPAIKYSPMCVDLIHGVNELDDHSRLIITDETVLTLVLNNDRYERFIRGDVSAEDMFG